MHSSVTACGIGAPCVECKFISVAYTLCFGSDFFAFNPLDFKEPRSARDAVSPKRPEAPVLLTYYCLQCMQLINMSPRLLHVVLWSICPMYMYSTTSMFVVVKLA